MHKFLTSALVCGMVVAFSGCGTTGKFVYPANMSSLYKVANGSVLDKKIAIVPFDDYRSDENGNWGLMYLIPLCPFGWMDYERPDAASMFATIGEYDVTPSEDLAKAAAVSFRRAGLFADAYYTMGGEKDKADFVLSGRIKVMRHNGKMITYGLSVFGPYLWVIGLPCATAENTIALELELKNRSGKIVWECTIDRQDWICQWLYYHMGWDCKNFSSMYQDAMNEALVNLSARINSNPELFK